MDFEKQHLKNLARYEKMVQQIYDEVVKQASLMGVGINFNPNKPFYFADYPAVKARIDKLINYLYQNVYGVILNGIDVEWTLANNKNSELAKLVFGDNINNLTKELEKKYFNNNLDAKRAFSYRKINGMDLSKRVWNLTDQYKEELEMGIDVGLSGGQSAAEMSRDLRKYLDKPDMLFRRVRDLRGNLHLSKRAKAYEPGRGKYRSSYKNALRLTATETNMAYRKSDSDRRKQLDFVVGIEVVTSNNHPVQDICDQLKGKYPKDFNFLGWHPFCRCHTISILKTDEELDRDNELIAQSLKPLSKSVNTVNNLPEGFTNWIDENADKIKTAKNPPLFLKENKKYTKIKR